MSGRSVSRSHTEIREIPPDLSVQTPDQTRPDQTGLSQEILRTFSGLSKDFLMTFSGHAQDFLRTLSGLSQDFPRTFNELLRTFA